LTVATERQIAANRRNARNSTGPRSSAAKKRASRNAYRHGLTLSLTSSTAFAKRLDKLARKIAGNSKSEIILQHARAAAQAELDLARVRQVKLGLIESVSALGALDAPQDMGYVIKAFLYLELALDGKAPRGRPPSQNPSIPWRRCRRRSLNVQLKPYEGRYRSCVSWIDTNPGLSLGGIEPSAKLL
jgi:hypothetical protein